MSAKIEKEFELKDGRKLLFREVQEQDAKSLMQCLGDVFKDDRYYLTTTEEAQDWMTVEKSAERIDKFVGCDDNLLLVAIVNGTIIGEICVNGHEKQRRKHVGWFGISIRPEYRGLGVASKLIGSAIEWGKDHDAIEKLTLGVYSTNKPGIALYEKMGFVEEGRMIKELKLGDGCYADNILMYQFV